MKLDIINLDGKTTGNIELSPLVFGLPERKDLLHRVVNWQRAAKRQGSAQTQIRSEVSRTGKKLYRQKGTGGARHGAKTSNIFVGGATQFGPRARDFSFSLNKKVRLLAIKTALSVKASGSNLVVLNEAATKTHKTKDLAKQLNAMGLDKATFVIDSVNENFDKASRNLPHVKVIPTEGINVYDILRREKLVLTEAAVKLLEAKLIATQKGEDTAKPARKSAQKVAKTSTKSASTTKKAAPKKSAAKTEEASA